MISSLSFWQFYAGNCGSSEKIDDRRFSVYKNVLILIQYSKVRTIKSYSSETLSIYYGKNGKYSEFAEKCKISFQC